MARIIGNRIVPEEVITEQDTWRTNMNPQGAWGNYGINTLGNAPFKGLEQFPLAHAGVAGPEYLDEDVLNMNQDLNNPDKAIGPIMNFKDAPIELNEIAKGLYKNNPRYGLIDQFKNQGGDETTGFKFPSIIGGIGNYIKDQFEYRPATEEAWDPNTGKYISIEDQNKQNALGGYYSDAARYARKQRNRVVKMLARQEAGKSFSEKNLKRLQELGYGPQEEIITTDQKWSPDAGTGSTYTGPQTYDYSPSQAARTEHYTERPGTQGGYIDPGRDSYGPWKAEGGRIGYANGEFVDEDINIQGPGYDVNENIEMASAQDPMDALNDMAMQIFGKPLHELTPEEKQILFEMANDQAAGPGQGEGIASLV